MLNLVAARIWLCVEPTVDGGAKVQRRAGRVAE
jgi:hypothetical protein